MPRPTAFDRQAALRRLGRDTFDVVVVGGGITGCGVALDAAARGLRTGLVEAADFASGTSSASSKLVHGGLRYLQHGEIRLVYEALAERQRLLANAPHLVHPLPFLIPLFARDGERRSRAAVRGLAKAYSSALTLYDLTGGLRIGHRHRRVTAMVARAHLPALRADRLVDSFVYWDAQADDARLTLAVARTAVSHGAAAANHAPVDELIERDGRVAGVRLTDGTEIRAGVVVNAGGVWSERIAGLGPTPVDHPPIRPAKGVHVTVRADRLPCDWGAVLAVPGDRRSIFVVPWDAAGSASADGGAGRFTYIGTTDTDHDGPLEGPAATPDDVAYLLGAVNAWTGASLSAADVTGTWAGLRPLIREEADAATADLSRRHQVVASPHGLVTVTGGKLTTYRLMAADTVDAVMRLLGRRLTYAPTRHLHLWGADGSETAAEPGRAERLGIDAALLAHLARRYGGEAGALAAMIAADPTLGDPLVPGLPYVGAEAVFAARYEMAGTLADVLLRRTRAWILDQEATRAAAPDVAALLAGELGWDAERAAAEVTTLAAPDRAAA